MRRYFGVIGALFLAAVGFWSIGRGTAQERLLIGGALMVVGLPLLLLSRRQLGCAFSVSPQAKGLVTHGLYTRIRNPMYVFLDVTLLGAVILLHRAWLLVPLAVVVLVQTWQARREVAVLAAAYGDAYRRYAERTWI